MFPKTMAHFHSYVSRYREDKDTREDETNQEPDTTKSECVKDAKSQHDSFPCPHCERRFTCKQGLERHMHIHNKKKTVEGAVSVQQPDSSSHIGIEASEGHHPCKYCTKVFNSLINRQRHERRFHEVQSEESQEENTQIIINTTSQQEVQLEAEEAGQYMLDISSNISENLSFYIDGKLISTSTVHEAAEVHSGSALVSVDALILDPTQVVNVEAELASQAKRRTGSPRILPQMKSELQPEEAVASSSDFEDTEKERTVILSPNLKEFLEKQEGLKSTLALVTDGPKSCSPVAISVLPTSARFKRRTSTPQHNEETSDIVDSNVNVELIDNRNDTSTQQAANEKEEPPPQTTEELAVNPAAESFKPLVIGGNSCNQKPLDLSNTVKRSEDLTLANAVLDLSLQKKNSEDSEQATNSVSHDTNATDKAGIGEQNANITPLVTDFAIVTSSDLVAPVDPVMEGLVYGLAIPTSGLTSSPTSLAPVTLQPASSCAIAFASPTAHTVLPTTPSLITVLAPPSLPAQSNQPIQVLAPSISSEPLVICADNSLNTSDLTTALTAANSANLVALSQPIDPALNIPGHVFLADPIALNPPLVDSTPVALNDLNSYNISSNTVLIECTISLEAPGNVGPTAIALQENQIEQPAQTQMLHIEQQQIVSVPSPQNADPVLMSSVAESVMLSASTISESPTATEASPVVPQEVSSEPTITKDEHAPEKAVSETQSLLENTEKAEDEEDLSDSQQQTFTKNFICNVCDKLFHSMKQLGQHVADHADDWPYKCEFCLLLFEKPTSLLEHRSNLHGVGKTYVCSSCTKEFVYLCNLKQHQEELHPGQQCTHTEEEKGKLRPQNYNNTLKDTNETLKINAQEETKTVIKKEEGEVDAATEELFTTIKIMASDGSKLKGPDVRLGINQHYPSFKPPPFPYHNRSPAGSVASATNFTTHNIPQTFSTAIRCTKCGKSFDNMPELHKHILACANASDKRRYTPKKNPIPLRHFAKGQNGVLSTTNSANGLNTAKLNTEAKMKLKVLSKRQKKLAQKRNKSSSLSNQMSTEMFVCPHCSREFTMRRSRTKHMAVCPKKPTEAKKRKDGVGSVTNENDGHQLRGNSQDKDKLQTSPHHKTRLQTGSVKRSAALPAETVFSSKRSKIVIKESGEATQETLNELPIVRTFNPAMRQYSRVHHSIKEIPIKITIVKPQQAEHQKSELSHIQGQDAAASTEQRAAV